MSWQAEIARALTEKGHASECLSCGGTEFEEKVEDRIDFGVPGGPPCEVSVRCKGCGKVVGWWAYGHWDPCFRQEELRRKSIRWKLMLWWIDTYDALIRRLKWLKRKLKTSMAR